MAPCVERTTTPEQIGPAAASPHASGPAKAPVSPGGGNADYDHAYR